MSYSSWYTCYTHSGPNKKVVLSSTPSVAAFAVMSIRPQIQHQESDESDLDSDDEAVNAAVENSLMSQNLATGGAPRTPATQSSHTALSNERVNIREIWAAITARADLQANLDPGPTAPQTPKPKRQRREQEDPPLPTPKTKRPRRTISQSPTQDARVDHPPGQPTACSSPLFAGCTCTPCERDQ